MSDQIDVNVDIEDFRRQLFALELRMQNRIARAATRDAARVFLRAAKAVAPVRTGTLRRALYAKALRNTDFETVRAGVRVRTGKKHAAKGRDAYYWPWVHEGHAARDGSRVNGNPFFRRAFDSAGSSALDAFSRRMARELAKE